MIVPGTRFAVARVPLDRISITMHEKRYPRRIARYRRVLADPTRDVLVHLAPYRPGTFRLLDGHHRFIASIMSGRRDVLALIIAEPGEEADLYCVEVLQPTTTT